MKSELRILAPPRILFLADRNILTNQAYNTFAAFSEDMQVRIKPDDIRKKGKMSKNGSLFFTIFQTFMSGPASTPVQAEPVEALRLLDKLAAQGERHTTMASGESCASGSVDQPVSPERRLYFGEYPNEFFRFQPDR